MLKITFVSNIHKEAEICCNRCSDFIILVSQCTMKLFKNVTVDAMKLLIYVTNRRCSIGAT